MTLPRRSPLPFLLLIGLVVILAIGGPVPARAADDTALLALQAAVVVRDTEPDRFPVVHRSLFEARHAHGSHRWQGIHGFLV